MNRPKVGVGVIVKRNGKILLGKRLNAHGDGSWSFPGGHLEYNESWEECGSREVLEETGLTVSGLQFEAVTNDVFEKEEKHYVTIFMSSDSVAGEAVVMEPNKCECWEWFDWNEMPNPLFIPIQHLREQGFNPF